MMAANNVVQICFSDNIASETVLTEVTETNVPMPDRDNSL